MTQWSDELREATVLTGDFNIAPLESDVWNHKALLDVVSHTPLEVATLAKLLTASDWVDLGRHFIAAPEPLYTRSEEHTYELQSLMRNSYAVLCMYTNTKNK